MTRAGVLPSGPALAPCGAPTRHGCVRISVRATRLSATAYNVGPNTVRPGRRAVLPLSLHRVVNYELLYWAMASIVALALLGGWLSGRARALRTTLASVLGWALLVAVVVWVLSRDGNLAAQAPLLAVAGGMFTLVIGAAAALLTRRIRASRTPPR